MYRGFGDVEETDFSTLEERRYNEVYMFSQ